MQGAAGTRGQEHSTGVGIGCTVSTAALRIHTDAIVIDGHYDRLYDTPETAHRDLPKLRAAGVTAHIRQTIETDTLQFFERTYEAIDTWPNEAIIATKAADVRRAKKEHKIATIFSIEGAESLRGDLTLLRAYYRLGLRNLGLTWNNRNQAADGVAEARTGGGLTEFGVKLVEEMRRLGIMLDISHLSPAGVKDVFALYEGPVVASHANAQAICTHWRNLTDEQIEQVAASGGLVGVTLVPEFIAENREEASLEGLLDHIDHIVRIGGADHVGLGTDWEGFDMLPDYFMQDITDLPIITEGLLRRGYTPADTRGILGENWLRVFEQAVG